MKKREKIIFIVLVCLCLLFPIRPLSADSGWDGGYDSGGSSWSSGSSDWGSSSSDWGSSSSYESGSYSGDSLDPLALIIAFAVIIFVFIITTRTSSRTMVAIKSL